MYVLAPVIDNLLERVSERRLRAVCIVLLAVFAADAAWSQVHPNVGEGVTDIEEDVSVLPHPGNENNPDDAVTAYTQTVSHYRQRSGS